MTKVERAVTFLAEQGLRSTVLIEDSPRERLLATIAKAKASSEMTGRHIDEMRELRDRHHDAREIDEMHERHAREREGH